MARDEMKILKTLKKAVLGISNGMMFDSLLNTIIAGIFLVGIIWGIIKIIELATGKKINIIPERFKNTKKTSNKKNKSKKLK